jgi:hypothetical protein
MGIDIFLRWNKMSNAAKQKQYSSGFSTTAGAVGYLREAYHGGPYATQIFFREAFEAENQKAKIPAAVMRERLDGVTEPARGCDLGHHTAQIFKKLVNAETISGEQTPDEIVKEVAKRVGTELTEYGAESAPPVTRPMTGREAIYLRCLKLYPDQGKEYADNVVKSFEAFIELAEKWEKKTGKPCTVIASY